MVSDTADKQLHRTSQKGSSCWSPLPRDGMLFACSLKEASLAHDAAVHLCLHPLTLFHVNSQIPSQIQTIQNSQRCHLPKSFMETWSERDKEDHNITSTRHQHNRTLLRHHVTHTGRKHYKFHNCMKKYLTWYSYKRIQLYWASRTLAMSYKLPGKQLRLLHCLKNSLEFPSTAGSRDWVQQSCSR